MPLAPEYLRKRFNITPEDARAITVLHWIARDDYRPFIAAVNGDEEIEPGWLKLLAKQLANGELARTYSGRRKRPPSVDAEMKRTFARMLYSKLRNGRKRKDVIATIAEFLHMEPGTVDNIV